MNDSEPNADVTIQLLLKEFDQINEYARASFEQLVNWFTFFLGVNYVAIGWFISQVLKKETFAFEPILLVTLFFVFQNALGFIACRVMKKYYKKTVDLIEKRYFSDEVKEAYSDHKEIFQLNSSSLPLELYKKIINLMTWTIVSLAFFWLLFMGTSLYVNKVGSKENKPQAQNEQSTKSKLQLGYSPPVCPQGQPRTKRYVAPNDRVYKAPTVN